MIEHCALLVIMVLPITELRLPTNAFPSLLLIVIEVAVRVLCISLLRCG